MPRLATRSGRNPSIRAPFSQISPLLGCTKEVKQLNSVVLPAPLGPITAWMRALGTLRLTLSIACKPPKRLPRPIAWRIYLLTAPRDGGWRRG